MVSPNPTERRGFSRNRLHSPLHQILPIAFWMQSCLEKWGVTFKKSLVSKKGKYYLVCYLKLPVFHGSGSPRRRHRWTRKIVFIPVTQFAEEIFAELDYIWREHITKTSFATYHILLFGAFSKIQEFEKFRTLINSTKKILNFVRNSRLRAHLVHRWRVTKHL